MPVERCRKNNKPGFRWGKKGVCYTYSPGNRASMNRARRKALKQGRAIKASQGR